MLKNYTMTFDPDTVYVAWDKRSGSGHGENFRKEASNEQEYKDNRNHKDNTAIFEACNDAAEIISSLGVRNMFPWILEGDDVMGWIADKSDRAMIITADRDMWQMINENVSVFDVNKKVAITSQNWSDHCPVDRKHYVLWKAILGDNSDNIKGLAGYGPKKSVKLVERIAQDGLDVLDKDQRDVIDLNIKLMDLRYAMEICKDDRNWYSTQFDQHQTNTAYDAAKFKERCISYGIDEFTSGGLYDQFTKSFGSQAKTSALAAMFS